MELKVHTMRVVRESEFPKNILENQLYHAVVNDLFLRDGFFAAHPVPAEAVTKPLREVAERFSVPTDFGEFRALGWGPQCVAEIRELVTVLSCLATAGEFFIALDYRDSSRTKD